MARGRTAYGVLLAWALVVLCGGVSRAAQPAVVGVVPEWEPPRRLVVVWPGGLEGREHLVPFYRRFITDSLATNLGNCRLTLIAKDDRTARRLRSDFPGVAPDVWVIPCVRDIWIRDWAPMPVTGTDGKRCLAKAKYAPRYLATRAERRNAEADDRAGRVLAEFLGMPLVEIPLVWDGGNFTHNGGGVGLVSNRLLADNESVGMSEIRTIFRGTLGITNLVFLPVEPGDDTGHVDGLVQFLDETTLALAEYPAVYEEGRRFLDGLERLLRTELGDTCRIVRVPCDEPEDCCDEIASAAGNHINFLRLGRTFLLPDFGAKTDGAAAEALGASLPGIRVVPVRTPGLLPLSRLGGILHCITACY